MRQTRFGREPEVDPFYDMLFNMLIAFVFLFIVALIAMNPKALKAGDVPAKAEYLLTVAWPDNDPNDIDTWVQSPAGEVVWYRGREAGLMHMDRDDRGASNDTVEVNGRRYVNPINQEVVTLRGIQSGEYVVNAHYFETGKGTPGAPPPPPDARAGQPVPVTLTLVKVNPRAELAYQGQATLAKPGDEATLLRFTIAPDGSVGSLNTLPKRLVQQR
jgi:hypothetical protein